VLGGARITRRIHPEDVWLEVQYQSGKGACEALMQLCTGQGFSIHELEMQQAAAGAAGQLLLRLAGRTGVEALVPLIGRIAGVSSVRISAGAAPREGGGAP
jgi:hypothetical protein